MAYTNNPSGRTIDQVRLLVGDVSTSTGGEFLSDPDYNYFITATGSNFLAAKLAATALANLFTGAAASADGGGWIEKSVGDLKLKKVDAVQAANSYRLLAQQFSRSAASGVAPYAGGITRSDKIFVESDGDRTKPQFKFRAFDNPGANAVRVEST